MSSDQNSEHCDECGGVISVGDYPFCKGNPAAHEPVTPMIEKCLDYWDPHISRNGPVHITDRAQRKALMRANGLEELGVKRGMPGQMI